MRRGDPAARAAFSSLGDALLARARETPERRAYTFLLDGEDEGEHLSYGRLAEQARAVAAALQDHCAAGDRAVLLYPPGLEFIAAFFGCLLSGVAAVPAYPPRPHRGQPRLRSILLDARPAAVLTSSALLATVATVSEEMPELAAVPRLVTDALPPLPDGAWRAPAVRGADLAFLQYTSGSTAAPRGVMVSHANLLANEEAIRQAFRQSGESVVVSWLPTYHDMGLIGGVLQPLFAGARCLLMSPLAFLQRPARWLEAISRYRATTSGGPNFAYELCLQKITPDQCGRLDLSSWEVAFNGAEPVRAETLVRFAARFAPCGFRREAFHPCYGLAEATLLVSGRQSAGGALLQALSAGALAEGRVAEPAGGGGKAVTLVGCGALAPETRVAIADPQTGAECAAGTVGEIWVAGPGVAQGYWGQPEETRQTFCGRLDGAGREPFLRTGDVGFMVGGSLFVAGRLKDLIIIRGRNHYPQDIELTVERSDTALRAGCGAAFALEVDGEERLVVVQEVGPRPPRPLAEIAARALQAVAEEHEVEVHRLVLIAAGTIPKTTSGKIQRRACSAALAAARLQVLWASEPRTAAGEMAGGSAHATPGESSAGPAPPRLADALRALPDAERPAAIARDLVRRVARLLRIPASRIAEDRPLTQLGLDSLHAVELSHEIAVELGVALSLADLMSGHSLAELAAALAPAAAAPPERVAIAEPAGGGEQPLSHGQKALWFIDRLAPGDPSLVLAGAAMVRSAPGPDALRRAFAALVDRHAALRTCFGARAGEPWQRVREGVELDFAVGDASGWSSAELLERVSREAHRPCDLEHGSPLRIRLWTRGGGDLVLLVAVHHIVADLWSAAILLRELGALLRAGGGGPPAALAPLAATYLDCVRAEERRLAGPEGERLWSYWRGNLHGELPALELPTDLPRPPQPSRRGAVERLRLPAELLERLSSLGSAQGATLFITLLTAFQALLHRYSGQEDLLVGTPGAGREAAAAAPVVGYFVNPLVLRADLSGEPTVIELLGRTRAVALAAYAHQGYPFALLAQRLQPAHDASRSPLFQAMCSLQGGGAIAPGLAALAVGEAGARLQLDGLTLESLALPPGGSQFDLTLAAARLDGELATALEYSTDLFDAATARRMLGHFRTLLEGAAHDPFRPVWALPLLTAGEREQLLGSWQGARADFPRHRCLHELLFEQVERTPDAAALVHQDRWLSYRQLGGRASRLARRLRELGVGPEARVAVCLERSLEMVVAVLAVLEAGGAYVPLDPTYPVARLAYVLRDCGAVVVLSSERLRARLRHAGKRGEGDPPWLTVEEEDGGEGADADRLAPLAAAVNLAYVLYTSGSTGRPKGVEVTHRSLLNFLSSMRREPGLEAGDVLVAVTTLAFDISILELFAPLLAGGRVVLASAAAAADGAQLLGLLRRCGATVLQATPATWRLLIAAGWRGDPRLKALCGGEALDPELAAQLGERAAAAFNLYGPTETTVWSALERVGERAGPVAIGRPIANTEIYILDRRGEPVPAAVSGELYIGGCGVARGYLGRPELTAERFVPDAFSTTAGARLYRTGDLARFRADGRIEFQGRLDHQVKIRGFRIELGEIEALLGGHPEVREAVAVAVPAAGGAAGNEQLVAYVVSSAGAAELRRCLRERLPDYMVPAAFVHLGALPRTLNGKVDRRALTALPRLAQPDAGFVPPRGPLEEMLAAIWRDVLGRERIGAHDDFFALGGHSLLVIQVVSRVRQSLGRELPVAALFSAPTLAELAARLEEMSGAVSLPAIVPAARPGALPLSFAQQRLWFLDQLQPGSPLYNLPHALHLRGQLRPDALAWSLGEVVRRHEALRTVFRDQGGTPEQIVLPPFTVPLPVVDWRALAPAVRQRELASLARRQARGPFDLATGPLLRACLARLEAGEHVLLLTLHHIVADGWSLGVLAREVAALYGGRVAGRPPALSPLPVQYADFAIWQRRWPPQVEQLAYWRGQLAGVPRLELPADRPRPAVESSRGARHPLALSNRLAADLEALSRRHAATLFMTLLASFMAVARRHSGQTDFAVGSPVANRNRLEIEGLIGFFANTLVLRCAAAGSPSFSDFLARVRATALAAYTHQDVPFERLIEELRPERAMSHNPLFQLMLVLQNAPLAPLDLPALELTAAPLDGGTSKFDLTAALVPEGGRLSGWLEYSTDLFDATTIARFSQHWQVLLEAVAAGAGGPLEELPLLAAAEQHQLLAEWSCTRELPAQPAGLEERCALQAARTPDAVAVLSPDLTLSYRELDQRAGRLARRLRRLGVAPEVLVGVFAERSPEMLIGVLAILKAGGAYLPLDPAYPAERLAFMLAEAAAPVLLTQRQRVAALPPYAGEVVLLDGTAEPGPGADPAAGAAGTDSPAGAANLAYVIHTSGSTGRPKGVTMTRGALANLLAWQQREALPGAARTLQFASLSFDVSFQEIFSTWLAGGTLVLVPEETRRDPYALLELISRQRIERVFLPFAALRQLAEAAAETSSGEMLTDLVTAGEQLQVTGPLAAWLARLPRCRLHNHYGPSESHVVTAWTLRGPPGGWPALPPIGRPIANTRILVLDPRLGPVPTGVAGEIYIGGEALSRGYLHRPDLTAERFVPDPFTAAGRPGARLYRTGDLARWLPGGALDYLGRIDDQVKVRGYRIEPGEVEAALSRHPRVRSCVVLALAAAPPAGVTRLAAYLVPDVEPGPDAAELRAFLARQLPEPMVPALFVVRGTLPLTPSGKVDRRALARAATAPDSAPEGTAHGVPAPPRSAAEELLAGIWTDLLGVSRVGSDDNFFALGGHSLLGTQLVSRVRAVFSVELPLRDLFAAPTLAALAARIVSALGGRRPPPPIRPAGAAAPAACLSFAQERLWFLDQLEPGSAAHNLPAALRLSGPLDAAALALGLAEIVRRHGVLRARFLATERGPRLAAGVSPGAAFALPRVDLTALPAARRGVEAERLAAAEARRPFDLSRGPLLRASLLELAERRSVLLLNMHHIASDGWSIGVLARELGALYPAFLHGGPSPLPPLAIQYTDFARWQRDWLAGEVLADQLSYWRDRLAGAPAELELPTDRARPVAQSWRGRREPARFSPQLWRGLAELARREAATLFMVLLAGFEALLARHGGGDDFLVGVPVANRNRGETEGLIGFFVNTLVLRADLAGEPSMRQAISRVRASTLAAQAHQDLPFEKLVEALAPGRSLGHSPLFQAMVSFNNVPPPRLELAGLELELLALPSDTSKFDLSLDVDATGEVPGGWIEYSTDLFDRVTVLRLMDRLERLLGAAALDPDQPLAELALLDESESRQLLYTWQGKARPEPRGCVTERFEAQAARTPEALAVIGGEGGGASLTYRELNQSANRVAHRLRALGVGREVVVGVCLERSPDLIVALLGILKAGGCYLPLAPSLPPARLAFVLRDAAASLVIAEERRRCELAAFGARVVAMDGAGARIAPASAADPRPAPALQDLAYVIYTSGSQGTPKGVMVEHGALAGYIETAGELYALGPGDRVLQFAAVTFDASAEEIYPTLLRGAALVLRDEEMIRSPSHFLAVCRTAGITVLDLPTAYFHQLAASLEAESLEMPPALRLVILGGERLLPERLADWRRHVDSRVAVVNTYGPTEATIVATQGTPDGGLEMSREVPIGRPVAGGEAYVLERAPRLALPGAGGELALGGRGLARGYLNRPDLTAERFVPHPFARRPGERLYRTGDRAKHLPDGRLLFLGRTDSQLKVRGFRVEPGEIEAVLLRHPAVRAAAVLAAEDRSGGRRLVACYVPQAGAAAPAAELRELLQSQLPDYMVPSRLVRLAELPLTAHGKLDRRALAALAAAAAGAAAASSAPGGREPTQLAEVLAGMWSEVLGVEEVGPGHDFFELGGHSLLATQLISRVRSAFGVELPLRSVFESPTLGAMAQRLAAALGAGTDPLEPPLAAAPRSADLPLSFAQERLWFLDQLEPGGPAYNLPAAALLDGRLDAAALGSSLTEIVRRHESLRTTFDATGGRPRQCVATPAPLPLPLLDLTRLAEPRRQEEARRLADAEARHPFDLARGPLLRARLLRLAARRHLLLLNMHHIVSDGWSAGVFLRELAALYGAHAAGEGSPLAEPVLQYADFSTWQRQWLSGERLARQLGYWRERLAGAPAVSELPSDRPRPAVQGFRGRTRPLPFAPGLAQALRALCRRERVTPFMALLATLDTLLWRYSGQQDLLVGTPIANRNRLETEGLIGFFVNTLVLRTDCSGEPSFRRLLARVRDGTLAAHAHQDLPFEKLVEALAPERNLAHSPFFQLLLVLQNAPLPELELPGLRVRPLALDTGTSKFDLTLAFDQAQGFCGTLEYDADLFDDATIGRLADHLLRLLAGAAADPGRLLRELPLLSAAERQQIVVEWNATRVDDGEDRCLHELIAAQAARTPEEPAVIGDGEQLTYRELELRADRLARDLRGAGVGLGTLVGICAERSLEMVVGLLGILKAGAAYVPLDPGYPAERLAFMLRDAGAPVLLTEERWLAALPPFAGRVVLLEPYRRDSPPAPAEGPLSAPAEGPLPAPAGLCDAHAAYVIYTSGSTGRPKGAINSHRAVRNRLLWMQHAYGLAADDRFLHKTPLSFDVSVCELFAPLVLGARLVLARPGGHQDSAYLVQRIASAGVTTAHFVPAMLRPFLAERGLERLRTLRRVVCSGEALPFELQQLFFRRLDARLLNFYGPTETAVEVTHWACERQSGRKIVPIGRPIANLQTHILDGDAQELPVGVPGELYIGGAGVSRGYLGRPELTAERFVPSPYGAEPGARLYRTGDLARYRSEGEIEFIGRRDFQVKVRGLRIELGEIEGALTTHPGLLAAVVLARETAPGDQRLVAYTVARGTAPAAGELRAFLKRTLPEHMLPSIFVDLPALPLTPSGKLDRSALPSPSNQRPELAATLVLPRTPVEEDLAKIWRELLRVERLGVHDNFFELGGHSLLATQALSRVREVFGIADLPLRSLFSEPTIEKLALEITQRLVAREDGAELARMIADLGSLSGDETAALLAPAGAASEEPRGR